MIFDLQLMDIIFLPIVFFIGIITSIEDSRSGKIRNKWIMFGFVYWLIMFSLFFIWNFSFDVVYDFFTSRLESVSLLRIDYSYLLSTIINGFVTLIFAFVLWELGIIAAGDAKLFWIYSLLVPITYYWKTYLPIFPSVVLFINTFFVIVIYLFLISVYSYLKDNKGRYKKSFFKEMQSIRQRHEKGKLSVKTIIGPIVGFLAIIITINLVADYYRIEIHNLPAYVIILLFLFRRFLSNFFVKKNILEYVALYLLFLFLFGLTIDAPMMLKMLWDAVRNLTIIIIVLSVVAFFIERYINKTSVTDVLVSDLKEKMIVDRDFIRKFKQNNQSYRKEVGRIYASGLTRRQASVVRDWALRSKIKRVKVLKPFRLGVWIFLGVIVTLLAEGSLIKLIMK